ncbi:uncharacterized protein M437DRAFT_56215, partial [Aureobasidium melanogenum CBS 110374]
MLGLGRAIGTVTRIRDQRLAEEDGKIEAFFKPFRNTIAPPGTDDWWKVDIYSSLQAFSLKGVSLIPEPDTPVMITFYERETPEATELKKYVYKGTVVENLFDTPNVTFVARVSGRPFWKFNKETVSCSVEVTGNEVSVIRQHAAFSVAAKGLTRDKSIDWDHILFDAPPTPSTVSRNAWTEEIKQYEGMKEEFLKEAKDTFNLNDKQMEFTKHFVENDTGISLLVGPPGTGKSVDMAAIILLYLTLNKKYRKKGSAKKILVTAPSNVAVDELLSKCIAAGSEKMGLKLVRFKGGKPSLKRDAENDVAMAGTDDAAETLEDAYWNIMEATLGGAKNPSKGVHKDREFIADFIRTIKGWPKNHASKNDAKAYLGLLEKLISKEKGTAVQRRQLIAEKDELQEKLYKAYWEEVDAAFTTMNGASNDALASFEPTLAAMDEIAQANLGDMLTVLVPFPTIENAVGAGDPRQIRGRALAEGRNEFFVIQLESVMHKVVNRRAQTGEDHTLSYVQLEVQHRMDPEIGGPISDIFYGGKLIHAPVTMQVQPVRETWKDCFKQHLGAAYDGNNRFAIDISGEKNQSVSWKGSTSLCNQHEADAICQMIKVILQHPPPANGVRVEPHNIIITTDYAGQESLFKVMLQRWTYRVDGVEQPLGGSGDNRVRVSTTSKTQGSEGDLQFISLVKNDVKKLGSVKFIATPEFVNVKWSRAKYGQVVVCNMQPLHTAIKNGYVGWVLPGSGKKKAEFIKMITSFWP